VWLVVRAVQVERQLIELMIMERVSRWANDSIDVNERLLTVAVCEPRIA
jgi:hypothetical protein